MIISTNRFSSSCLDFYFFVTEVGIIGLSSVFRLRGDTERAYLFETEEEFFVSVLIKVCY